MADNNPIERNYDKKSACVAIGGIDYNSCQFMISEEYLKSYNGNGQKMSSDLDLLVLSCNVLFNETLCCVVGDDLIKSLFDNKVGDKFSNMFISPKFVDSGIVFYGLNLIDPDSVYTDIYMYLYYATGACQQLSVISSLGNDDILNVGMTKKFIESYNKRCKMLGFNRSGVGGE